MALTTEDEARWHAWQQENRRQSARSDRAMRILAAAVIVVTIGALIVAVIQR